MCLIPIYIPSRAIYQHPIRPILMKLSFCLIHSHLRFMLFNSSWNRENWKRYVETVDQKALNNGTLSILITRTLQMLMSNSNKLCYDIRIPFASIFVLLHHLLYWTLRKCYFPWIHARTPLCHLYHAIQAKVELMIVWHPLQRRTSLSKPTE